MTKKHIIENIEPNRWELAQKWELQEWASCPEDSDDWNSWWMYKFDNYNFLKNYKINSMIEVGCGPYCRNIRNVLGVIGGCNEIYLEDPLLDQYIALNKFVKHMPGIKISKPLEETVLDKQVDCVICCNVIGHCFSTQKCFEAMINMLAPNGILIFAEDLANEEDYSKMPVCDVGHPLRLDLETCETYLKDLKPIYNKVLPREDGRNPECHYATMIYAGIKS